MSDKEFLHRRRMVRLMKQLKESQRGRDAREAQADAVPRNPSPELQEALRRLKEIADKLDRSQAGT